jgi:activator of HSP90 ATPase
MTTRRLFCVETVAALAALGLPRSQPEAETIHQELTFNAPPDRIYTALLDETQFAAMTGRPAHIEAREGGAFSLFDGQITGRNVQLVPNARIVQAWRSGSWSPGVYSIARFELTPLGSGTKLVFDHTGFPVGTGKHLLTGWNEHYWAALQRL